MRGAEPHVSVLIPAWNAGATITACLESIHRQTLSDWECIVVDDGSSDATATLVRHAALRDTRIRLIAIKRRGLVPALNEGLAHCQAPLIARMDADDVMRRERLAAQLEMLHRDRSLNAVGCHVRIFPRSAMYSHRRDYEAWLNSLHSADEVSRDAFVECPVVHPTLMMRRDMAQLAYCDRHWPEDYDLFLRALAAGMRIGVVPRRLLAWRARSDSWSRTNAAYSIEQFTACKAHYLARGFLARTNSYVLWGYGATGRTLRRALAAYHKTPTHIVEVKRSRIGQRIHGAQVIPISELVSVHGAPLIVSVARLGPRSEIRNALAAMNFVEGQDFVCAA